MQRCGARKPKSNTRFFTFIDATHERWRGGPLILILSAAKMQSLRSLTACLPLLVLFAEQALSQSMPRPHLGLRTNLPRQTASITATVTAVQSTATLIVTSTEGTSTNTPTSLSTPSLPSSGPTSSKPTPLIPK